MVARTTDTTTFSELHQNLRGCFDRLKETGRPLWVTSNGQPDAVVLSPEMFEQLVELAERVSDIAGIERGLADVKAGRVRDFREAMFEIADKLGLKLER